MAGLPRILLSGFFTSPGVNRPKSFSSGASAQASSTCGYMLRRVSIVACSLGLDDALLRAVERPADGGVDVARLPRRPRVAESAACAASWESSWV